MMYLEYPGMEEPIPVYASDRGGVLHCMIRATDRATFLAQAVAVGLLVEHEYQHQVSPGVYESVITLDEDGDEVSVTNEIEPAVYETRTRTTPAWGVDITEVGTYTRTPATYDEEGNELTPADVDTRWHVNFWLSPALVEKGEWEQWAVGWTANGVDATPNKNEVGRLLAGIELIDPETIPTPANRLL